MVEAMRKFAGNRAARKVVGSLAVIGTAAAVAGLGTFGAFTDSTSVTTNVQSGVVSIDLSAPGGIPHVIPVSTTGFMPGDSLTRAINLRNDGTVALSSVSLATTASSASALTSDPVNGLQLKLEQCSRGWTRGGTDALPTYTCAGTTRTLYSGPVISADALLAPKSLNPGATDNLTFTVWLPTTAGNELQTLSATVNIGFTAVQATGGAR